MSEPTAQRQRLAEQLTLFKDRLLDIDTRNPSLFLRRDVQERAFDLAKLGSTVASDVYTRLLRGTAPVKLLSSAEDYAPLVQMRGHLQKLARAARAREEETGLRELYVGLCFVTGHVADAYLRGPLLLVPARLELSQGKRDAGWQLQVEPEELVLNAAILAAIRKHRGIRLPDSLLDDVLSALEALRAETAEAPAHTRIHDAVTRLCAAGGLTLARAHEALVQPLAPLTKASLPPEQQPLRATWELVLGLFPQSSTALYADLEAMIERAHAGEGDMGVVDNLLEVPADKTVETGDSEQGRSVGDLPEGSVHCVIPTDPSQHAVVQAAQSADVLVVRGPPGTGKSQTIVNLVSDALARQKRVLVVCQKRAALDVVYRRLNDVGLSGSAALVHDASADRADLYKRLQAQLQATLEGPAASAQSAALAASIDERVRTIRSVTDPLGSVAHGLPLHDVYATARSGFRPSLDVPEELVRADYTTAQRVCGALEQAKAGRLRFDDAGHPLALRQRWASLGHVESARLNDALFTLGQEAQRGGAVAALPDAEVGLALRGHVDAFMALQDRWFRWFSPRWWRAKSAVARAMAWFGSAALTEWRGLIDRHARLAEQLGVFANAMRAEWHALHARALTDLPALASVAESTRRALDTDLDGIRAYDRARGELQAHEQKLLDHCAARLGADVDWGRHVREELFLRWIDEAEAKHPRLRDRIAEEHAALRTQIEAQTAERRRAVARELARNLQEEALTPSFDPRDENHPNKKAATDWNKLSHEVGKKRRVKSLRALVTEFAWPMKQQVRCWLASPEVVAEVFPLERGHFDVVIFDEASQLTLERALPVIYRAKQVVIAGDEQQMPPSNFFSASVEEEGEDAEEDEDRGEARFAESLLAQAKRVYGFRYLAWHYRSAFQELIEFSNHAFYDGALQVAANLDCGTAQAPMQWISVNGVWLDQTNPVEARRTVDEIKRLMQEHAQKPRSFGVITFNMKQQALILDEIESRRGTDPEFEALWAQADNPQSGSLDDKPFVKNIENVQGDERDYILFSVAYAPGPDGVLRRNFGPLGLNGGENRLNVAITRAKRGIRVICSFDPDTLAVDTLKNRGPLLLKRYLQYARAVSAGDPVRVHGVLKELNPEQREPEAVGGAPRFESPLEEAVYDALTRQGLKLYAQWGAGGYRVDLVVVDPEDPNRLCLGIMCDGAAYHRGGSVRERDLARQAFLEARGWRIHRVWSRDWWKDPGREVQRVLELVGAQGANDAAS